MADYFPLISRAVSSLDPNTPLRREAIYVRAREALDRQLLSLDPPIPEADLSRERRALETTIQRVEAQFAPPPAAVVAPSTELPAATRQRGDIPPPAREIVADPGDMPSHRPKVAVGAGTGFFADRRRAMFAAIGLPVVLLIAGAAYLLRDDPGRFAAQQPGASQDAASAAGGRKNDGRLDGTGTGPVAGPRPATAANAPQDKDALPVSSRVLFFEESAADPRGIQSDGIVIWRLEPIPAAQGRPADQAIRGSMTISGAKFTGDLVIKRNRDAVLPASHTIELVFRPEAGRDGIKEISPIEARDQETNPGVTLQGAMVPVATNLFLIGLDKGEANLARNLDVLRDKRWFAFQFRFVNGKLGAMLIEKGATGDRVFREALDSWR